jgi:hypothetical protein
MSYSYNTILMALKSMGNTNLAGANAIRSFNFYGLESTIESMTHLLR